MWVLANRTPFAAERNWIRDKGGVHHWLVAVRATFAIRPGGVLEREANQTPPILAPEYFGEPGTSSLRVDSDLLALKPATEIVADAHAHAPGGHPTEMVVTTLQVGELQKTVMVHGERYYRDSPAGLRVTSTAPFVSRPIRYEAAYGGWDKAAPEPRNHRLDLRNPVGRGFAVHVARLANQLAPATQYPDGDVAQHGPAGFGPIDAAWSPRREFAGTYDDAWARSKRPLLPDNYDDRFALSAPVDQQVAPHLRGGERVDLVNLTADGRLTFHLPRHYFAFTTRFRGRSEEHRGRMTTVFIEPEVPRVSLVWQTSLPVKPAEIDYLDSTIISEKEYVR